MWRYLLDGAESSSLGGLEVGPAVACSTTIMPYFSLQMLVLHLQYQRL